MTIRLFAIAFLVLLLPARPDVSAQELSAKEVKKAVRQADKALAAGQTEHAAELYAQVLASTPAGDGRRADALYALALIHLSAAGDGGEVAAAGEHLEELAEAFPRHPRRTEIAATYALVAELEAVKAKSTARDAELEAKIAALEEERQAAEAAHEEIAGESEAVGDKVKSLEAQLRNMRAERNDCRGELEKKEVALQKLKDALVGRAGGSG